MDIDSPSFNAESVHLILELPNGQELEHKKVPTSETFWSILQQFESKFNQNLCKKYNKENRFELPQLLYNNYPFASTLQQLLSTKLSDITSNRKAKKDAVRLVVVFKPQAFSINELDVKISKIEKELKAKEKSGGSAMDLETKQDDDEDNKKASGLDRDFAMDVDPVQAESTEEILRKMERLLYNLCKELKTKEQFVACMKLLRKVVNNLIIHPLDKKDNDKNKDPEKYRKLNLNNAKLKQSLFQYQPALDLLLLIGFQKKSSTATEAYIVMPPQNENSVVFQALVVKIGNQVPPKAALPTVDLNVKIYELEDLNKFKKEEQRRIAEERANKGSSSEMSLSSQHRKAMENAYKKRHPDKLMGKELREKMYGVQQKEYRFTLIRIEFPSKLVLEAKFHPNTAIFKLFEFVRSFLDDNVLKLKYQLLLPPHQIIKNKNDENQTFKSMGGMIPACTIRFALNPKANTNTTYNGKYIRNEFIDKFMTKDITSLRSPKSKDNDESKNDNDQQSGNSNNNNKNKPMTKEEKLAAFKRKKAGRKAADKLARLQNLDK